MRPAYSLSLGGEVLKERLQRLVVVDRAGFVGDTLSLTLRAEELALPARGVPIECSIGFEETGLWSVGSFFVEDVKLLGPPDTFSIECISQPQGEASRAALQLTKKERTWQRFELEGTTFGDVVSEVCGEAGLTAKVDNRLASIKMPLTVQSNESDAAFLHRITSERNGLVKMNGQDVIFVTRDAGGIGTLVIANGVDVLSYAFDFTERYDIESVRAKYQDVESGEVKNITLGSGKGVKVMSKVFPDAETAEQAADALLKHYKRSFVSANLKIVTVPGLLSEKLVNLTGFPGGEDTNRQYVCVVSKHTLTTSGNKAGLTSDLTLKRLA